MNSMFYNSPSFRQSPAWMDKRLRKARAQAKERQRAERDRLDKHHTEAHDRAVALQDYANDL